MVANTVRDTHCALLRSSRLEVPVLLKPLTEKRRTGAHGRVERGWLQTTPYRIAPGLTHLDRAIIRNFYACPGFAAAAIDDLGNVSRRQWSLNDPLPDDLYTALLPAELEQKLSVLPVGFERVLVKNDVLLVDTVGRTVVDAFSNVQRHAYS